MDLWHGCIKISEGCKNCYVFRRDSLYEIDSKNVYKTRNFDLPLKRKRDKSYKIAPGEHVWTCFTSDFFIEEADEWRDEAWKIISQRNDLTFSIATKRIDRIQQCLPGDWNSGYDNVRILCSIENQKQAELRLPAFKQLSIAGPQSRDKFCSLPGEVWSWPKQTALLRYALEEEFLLSFFLDKHV